MIAEGGYAKVLDFGIAKLRADPMQNRSAAGQEPTATEGGRLLGTLGYMSPEQVQGQPTRLPHGHLFVRVRPLRGNHRQARISGRERLRDTEGDRRARAGAAVHPRAVGT